MYKAKTSFAVIMLDKY